MRVLFYFLFFIFTVAEGVLDSVVVKIGISGLPCVCERAYVDICVVCVVCLAQFYCDICVCGHICSVCSSFSMWTER